MSEVPVPVEPYFARGQRKVAGYTLLSPLVQTGRSRVYLGETDDGARVALKVGRFLEQEEHIRTQAAYYHQLNAADRSPYVVDVLDFAKIESPYQYNGTNYSSGLFTLMVLPFFEAGSLADIVYNPSVDLRPIRRDVLSSVGDAIDGIAGYIVHTDVKPGNTLLKVERGKRKSKIRGYLTDFDLAIKPGVPIDRNGVGWGTAQYCAPEHIISRTVFSHQTDILGGAVMAKQLLDPRRKPLFTNSDEAIVAYCFPKLYAIHLDRQLSDFPTRVQDVLRHGLAYHPEDRPGSFYEFHGDLEYALAHPTLPTVIYRAGKRIGSLLRGHGDKSVQAKEIQVVNRSDLTLRH